MPTPLPFDYTPVKLRIRTTTLDTIRVLHPNVNEFVRVLLDAYVDRINGKLAGPAPATASGQLEPPK